jgi:hypothetical protein
MSFAASTVGTLSYGIIFIPTSPVNPNPPPNFLGTLVNVTISAPGASFAMNTGAVFPIGSSVAIQYENVYVLPGTTTTTGALITKTLLLPIV